MRSRNLTARFLAETFNIDARGTRLSYVLRPARVCKPSRGNVQMSYWEPALPLLILLAFVNLATIWRSGSRKSRRPWLLALSMAGILFLSMNAGAWILSRPLEAWYSAQPVPAESVDAIVILAGSVRPPHRISHTHLWLRIHTNGSNMALGYFSIGNRCPSWYAGDRSAKARRMQQQ